MPENSVVHQSTFAKAVHQGLTANPKHLPSRYIYDERGDALFQEIMNLPQYYLTRCEKQILEEHGERISAYFWEQQTPFNLVELGAGDGTKTEILLRDLMAQKAAFRYMPVDISSNALEGLQTRLEDSLPGLQIHPWEGSYFEMLRRIDEFSDSRKVILFLGSNLGNMMHSQARSFLSGLSEAMTPLDYLFIGFDQKKDPRKILDAYNDPKGVTAAFNKNILYRINRELDADFDPDRFLHWETYNPESGAARSYLVAQEEMLVHINSLDLELHLRAWETIYTELSQKYDDAVVAWLAEGAGLEVVEDFADPRGYYKDYLFRKAAGK
jgi:dimethylhistidine N-methyltransferase